MEKVSNRRRKYTGLIALLLLVILLGRLAFLIYQQRLNYDLFTAIRDGHADTAISALQKGADPNAWDHGRYPFSWHELINRLHGQDTEHVEDIKLTPLLELFANHHLGGNDWLPIQMRESLPLLQTLLNKGAQVNVRSKWGYTPLMLAVSCGYIASVRALLDRGADVNGQSRLGGRTALMYAAGQGEDVCVRLLVQRGADVNAKDRDGETPLMLAAIGHCDSKTISLLLEKGADVKAKNIYGGTALIAAASGNDADTVRLLLDWGAEVNAVEFARSGGNGETALLVAALSASEERSTEVAKLLLDAGANVNARGEDSRTALTRAAEHDNASLVRLLIARGAHR